MSSADSQETPCDSLILIRTDQDACVPTRASAGSAGLDIHTLQDEFIPRMGTVKIRTGLSIAGIPENVYCRIAERSSVSLQKLLVGGGVIDNDYRGEVYIVLHNIGDTGASIPAKTPIAQLILEKIHILEAVVCREPDDKQETNSTRGNKGFGEMSGAPLISFDKP